MGTLKDLFLMKSFLQVFGLKDNCKIFRGFGGALNGTTLSGENIQGLTRESHTLFQGNLFIFHNTYPFNTPSSLFSIFFLHFRVANSCSFLKHSRALESKCDFGISLKEAFYRKYIERSDIEMIRISFGVKVVETVGYDKVHRKQT